MNHLENTENNVVSKEAILGIDGKIYTHPIFCQCILPIRALDERTKYYQVSHGKSSLVIQAGMLLDENGKAQEMAVPSGAKARIILSYITNSAKRTGSPTINMGNSLREFMKNNNIPIGGKNAKEVTRQARNIAAASMNLGIWGENEAQKYVSQNNYRVAKSFSLWSEKNPDQLSMWDQYITLSEEFMTAIEGHSVFIDFQPLIALQDIPRAMDMYAWLSYRMATVKSAVKISYRDLHSIFGQQTKELKHFKKNFQDALRLALPYVPSADLDMSSDKKHLIIRNNKNKIFLPSGGVKQLYGDIPVEEGVFGELQAIGLTSQKIKELTAVNDKEKIEKALLVTKQRIAKGSANNPPGVFIKALEKDWNPAPMPNSEKKEDKSASVELDTDYENFIKDVAWREVRKQMVGKLGIAKFNNWIKDLNISEKGRGEVVLTAKSRFIAEEIKKTYLQDLEIFWSKADKKIKNVIITVAKKK